MSGGFIEKNPRKFYTSYVILCNKLLLKGAELGFPYPTSREVGGLDVHQLLAEYDILQDALADLLVWLALKHQDSGLRDYLNLVDEIDKFTLKARKGKF